MGVTIELKGDTYHIGGDIDHSSDFSSIEKIPTCDDLKLNLESIKRINSTGVRQWVDFIGRFDCRILFIKCSISAIDQFNMVPQFLGSRFEIENFYAPYFCDECEEDQDILLDWDSVNLETREPNKSFKCSKCNTEMEADFDSEDYFRFFLKIIKQRSK